MKKSRNVMWIIAINATWIGSLAGVLVSKQESAQALGSLGHSIQYLLPVVLTTSVLPLLISFFGIYRLLKSGPETAKE